MAFNFQAPRSAKVRRGGRGKWTSVLHHFVVLVLTAAIPSVAVGQTHARVTLRCELGSGSAFYLRLGQQVWQEWDEDRREWGRNRCSGSRAQCEITPGSYAIVRTSGRNEGANEAVNRTTGEYFSVFATGESFEAQCRVSDDPSNTPPPPTLF